MTLDSYVCPTCGAEVKVGSNCPGCVSRPKRRRKRVRSAPRERKSWEQDSAYDGLNLPEDGFDYDDFVSREFGGKSNRTAGMKWYWWVTALVLLACFVWWILGGLF